MIIIIVLGHKLKSSKIHIELIGRMDVAIDLFNRINANFILLSGGLSNPNVPFLECELMKNYATKNGILEEKIIVEPFSLDTIGNAIFSRELIDRYPKESLIYIVSSCYHINRVEYIFSKCFIGYNLDFHNCFDSGVTDENLKHEKQSYELARNFFSEIDSDKLEEIKRYVYLKHDLYKKYID